MTQPKKDRSTSKKKAEQKNVEQNTEENPDNRDETPEREKNDLQTDQDAGAEKSESQEPQNLGKIGDVERESHRTDVRHPDPVAQYEQQEKERVAARQLHQERTVGNQVQTEDRVETSDEKTEEG